MNIRAGVLALLASSSLLAASAANAEVLKWSLQDATFNDGGTASGSFDFNTVTLAYTAIDITTTAGTVLSGSSYTVEAPFSVPRDYGFGSLVSLSDNAEGDPLLDINTTTSFDTPGTVSIGSANVFTSSEGSCFQDGCSTYVPQRTLSGNVVSTVVSVPEPSTWLLMFAGIGGLGVAMRSRRGMATASA